MNKYFWLISIMIINVQKVLCAEDGSGLGLKTETGEPNVLTIIFALLFVVFLIYITGVIYSKLNLVGAKKVREQLHNYDISRAIILSTTQLGQGKNLHVIEINKKTYLIGATPNSINLLTEIKMSNIDKKDSKPEENVDIDDAIRTLYEGKIEGSENTETKEDEIDDSFDIHKKYL